MFDTNSKMKNRSMLPHLKFKLGFMKSERFVRLRLLTLTSVTNKSNFIKMLSVLLVLSLLSLISLLPILSSRAYAETYPSINGITYLNMPEKTFGGKTTECKLTITNLNINNNKLNLSCILSYSNGNYYLNIEGTLYKSRIGKDNFVALAKDTTNTFNVLHLSILFNPNFHFLITKRMKNELSKPNASFNHSPIITVYLQRKGTREISFVEGQLNLIDRNLKNIKNTFSIHNRGIISLDYFAFELFLPIKRDTKLVKSNSYTRLSGTYNATDGPYETTYVFASPYGDGYTMYGIYYKARCFSYNGSDLGFFSYRLWNLYEFTKTYDKNWNETSCSDSSPFSLGSYSNPVSVTIGTNEAFSGAQFNYGDQGQFEHRYSPDIELSVGYGPLTASLSMTANRYKGNVGDTSQAFQTFEDPNNPNFTKTTKHIFYNTCLAYGGNSIQDSIGDHYVVAVHNYILPNVHPDLKLKANWNVPICMYAGFGQFSYYETVYLETYLDLEQ